MSELSFTDLDSVSGGTTIQRVTITAGGPNGGTLQIVNVKADNGEFLSTANWTPNKPA